jgi:glycosyltransferase involved in cell wall biosynthesis
VNSAGIPVLLVARALDLGGIERDVSKFARHLNRHGFAPHVACFSQGGARWHEIEAAGIPIVTLALNSFRNRSTIEGIRTLKKYVRNHRIHVLHAFDIPTDLLAVPLARTWGVPVTITSQLCYRELSPPPFRMLMACVDRIATGVFVNCEAIADHLVADWRVSRERIHVCYNGVETAEFNPHERSRPEQLADASVVIGSVAVLREEKNLNVLIDAFARVLRLDPRVRLLLVGSGPLKNELEKQCRDLGIAGACVFQEASPNPAYWMRALDIFVLPSRSEAFSNALLEAMACGCCPVGSRVGGTPELIRDGERGLLVNAGDIGQLADALCTLVQDPVKREAYAKASVEFVQQNLTIEIASARLASIYRRLLDAKGHPLETAHS